MQKRIEEVLTNIETSAKLSMRDLSEIKLIAVSKRFDIEKIKLAHEYGINTFGENYVQEFIGKYNNNLEISWHFIGQLQSNKVKYIVNKIDMLHSLDRMSLAKEINKRYNSIKASLDVLVQVNIAQETQKGGIPPNKLEIFLDEINDFAGINVKGLMCIHPYGLATDSRKYFSKMKILFDDMKAKGYDMEHLSMGMSADYQEAIEEGANIVRVGSKIFGNRY